MAQKPKSWHPEKIKAELRIRFGSLRAFAQAIEVAPSNVSEAIKSPRSSTPIELKIADALGVSPYEIWPTRWTRDGKKIDRTHADRPRRALRFLHDPRVVNFWTGWGLKKAAPFSRLPPSVREPAAHAGWPQNVCRFRLRP